MGTKYEINRRLIKANKTVLNKDGQYLVLQLCDLTGHILFHIVQWCQKFHLWYLQEVVVEMDVLSDGSSRYEVPFKFGKSYN